jgi:hypothetical protein
MAIKSAANKGGAAKKASGQKTREIDGQSTRDAAKVNKPSKKKK